MSVSLLIVVTTVFFVLSSVACRSTPALGDAEFDRDNRFANVGAWVTWEIDEQTRARKSILGMCSGALIHPQVFLTAGHCVAPGFQFGDTIPPSIEMAIIFSPRPLESDEKTWHRLGRLVAHPSVEKICTRANNYCMDIIEAPVADMTDVALIFLTEPVTGATLARLASPGALEITGVARTPMTVVGYGHFDSLPGGKRRPNDQWPGIRRVRAMKSLATVIDAAWARWEEPSGLCYGDSGGPVFLSSPGQALEIVAVVSDGGTVCGENNVHARLDTDATQRWISETIADAMTR